MFGIDDIALATVGSAIVGGLLGDKSQSSANETNARINAENVAMQKEFAQKGIQWRVKDAKAAGVHPVYALGASGASYSPSAIPVQANTAWSNAFESMGQNLTRYGMSRMSPDQKVQLQAQIAETAARADAASAEAQLARTRAADISRHWNEQPGIGVGYEGSGGAVSFGVPEHLPGSSVPLGNRGIVELKPSGQTSASRFDPSRVAGEHPAWQMYRSSDGGYVWAPSQEYSQSIQDMPLWVQGQMLWKNFKEWDRRSKAEMYKPGFKRRMNEYFDLYRR